MDNRDERDLLMRKKRRREEKSKLARKNALKVINIINKIVYTLKMFKIFYKLYV